MGKNVRKKRPNFGGMAEETITGKQEYTDTVTDTPEQESTDTLTVEPTPTRTPAAIPAKKEKKSTRTRTPAHTDTPRYLAAHLPTMGAGERKTERLQLVVRPSTKSRLAEYARDHGTSSNEVVQCLLDELLDEAGY